MRRIMVIDDDVSISRLLKQSLEKNGDYEVVVENTSALVAQKVVAVMPDLVLLDIAMPDKDGGDVKCEIREDRRTKNIPIIFLTSMVTKQENATHGGVLAGDRCLIKPVSVTELITEVEACLSPA